MYTRKRSRLAKAAATTFAIFAMAGCGLTPPHIGEVWDEEIPAGTQPGQTVPVSANTRIKFEIERRIYCDLRRGVLAAIDLSPYKGDRDHLKKVRNGLFPPNWAAQISMNIQIEEGSSFNPGLTLISPLANAVSNAGSSRPVVTPQSSSVGFGGTMSATATAAHKLDPYYSISYLSRPIVPGSGSFCERDPNGVYINGPFDGVASKSISSPFIIDTNDLGIEDWVVGSMSNYILFNSENTGKGPKFADKAPGPDTTTLELKFVIITSGNVTPTWKLARISANTGSLPLISGSRTRTHDLIITLGPSDERTRQTFFASQVGQAVSNGNRSLIPLQ